MAGVMPSISSCCDPCSTTVATVVSSVSMLSGAGSPEGVVAASLRGQLYTDTATGMLWNFVGTAGTAIGWQRASVLNAQGLGAKGNGLVDDGPSLQAAMQAAYTRGYALFIPAGTYLITTPIVLAMTSDHSLTLYGEGYSTVLKAGANITCLRIDQGFPSSNTLLHVHSLAFDLANRAATALETVWTGQTCIIERISVQQADGNTGGAIAMGAGGTGQNTITWVRDIQIIGQQGNVTSASIGLLINGNSHGFWVSNLDIVYMHKAVATSASPVVGGTELVFDNVRCEAGHYGFYFVDSGLWSLTIRNCRFEANSLGHIVLEGFDAAASRMFNVLVADNYFTDVTATAPAATLTNIEGFTFRNNFLRGDGTGIALVLNAGLTKLQLSQNCNSTVGAIAATMTNGGTYFQLNDVFANQTSADVTVTFAGLELLATTNFVIVRKPFITATDVYLGSTSSTATPGDINVFGRLRSTNTLYKDGNVFVDDVLEVAQFVEGPEIADPAAPAANKGRLYFRDNGAGKTQLVARFPTGAVQVVATEP